MGFGASGARELPAERAQDIALRAARQALPPELYNRIDEVIFYRPLGVEDIRAIAVGMLESLAASLADRGMGLEVAEEVLDVLLAQGGYQPEFGARPMRRAIARLLEAPLADLILQRELQGGSVALVDVDEDGGLVVDVLTEQAEARTA